MAANPQLVLIEQPILTPEQEQEKWLGEALRNVKERSALMKQNIKQGQFVQTLRAASQMLSELRTGMLSPQHYYELYSQVFDELQHLEFYFFEEVTNGRSLEDMYEVVQHAGNIVPRLYLLITVGFVYVKSKQAPANEILKDLVEMCKGVQHPTRGLFLRHYLLTKAKNILPDVGNEYEGENCTVEDSANFVLQNFKEMVWLWVRMEKITTQQARHRRERERLELRTLVGFNVVRLSQLDGIDKRAYQGAILPRILTIIMGYKEPLAQQYLFEVIVRVFPDEFHLYTLTDLLQAVGSPKVVAGVNVHSILQLLMERLGNYVVALRDGTAEGGSKKEEKVIQNMFTVFKEQVQQMAMNSAAFSPASFVETQLGLMKLVVKTYPGEYNRIDEILASLAQQFVSTKPDEETVRVLRRVLQYLAEETKDINVLMDLEAYGAVLETLPFKARRDTAITLCNAAINSATKVTDLQRVAKLFECIAPLIKDLPDTPPTKEELYSSPEEEFNEEQSLIGRLIHCIDNEDPALLFKMYSGVRKQLGQGGPERMLHTLVPMAFLYMRLAVRIHKLTLEGVEVAGGLTPQKPFQYLHSGDGKGILEVLVVDRPTLVFNMYLSCACAADVCNMGELAYDLFAEAFTIYEERAGDTKDQIDMLHLMIACLCSVRQMEEENYEVLATKVCQYSSKLLKKHDQSKMAATCSHLFWKKVLTEEMHKKVLECMQRGLKIANHANPGQQLPVFVELLNQFLHYYAMEVPKVTVKYITALLDLIREASSNVPDGEEKDIHDKARLYYRNTTKYIRSRQKDDERWQEIEV